MKFNLDFSIYSSKERAEAVSKLDLSSLTPSELETCSNYILYGKDEDGTSIVDRKEVQIKTKFSSYKKAEPISLDGLLESPTFNENTIVIGKNIYKKEKPSIDKEKAANVRGMKELWAEIEKLEKIYKENTNNSQDGEEETTSIPKLSNKQLYYLKHQIIELRTQQYYLMDSVYQTLPPPQNRSRWYGSIVDGQFNYKVFPRGVMRNENDSLFKEPRLDKGYSAAASDMELDKLKEKQKPYFDFRDKNHIYQLVLFYWDIKTAMENVPDSPLHNLLWTLDFYIEKADLSEQQMLIVNDKKLRLLNKDIVKHLQEELGIYHQENYISTIWNKITQKIADAAELNYDEWLMKDYDKAWKKCNRCGKEMLRDNRNFVRKAKSADGFTSRCKRCDKLVRQGRN